MSQPISACAISKACHDEEAYQWLLKAMKFNLEFGSYTQFPCRCDPPCPIPTDEELAKLNARMDADMKRAEPTAREWIEGIRGTPTKCDFCGQDRPSEQLEPEEGGEWVCHACMDNYKKETGKHWYDTGV